MIALPVFPEGIKINHPYVLGEEVTVISSNQHSLILRSLRGVDVMVQSNNVTSYQFEALVKQAKNLYV